MVETGIEGVCYWPAYFDASAQRALVGAVSAVVDAAPFFTPRMPRTGKPFSVRMTNCGPLGWVSDKTSYRYQPCHPETGAPWPPMPDALLALWDDVAAVGAPAEACLINHYPAGARMGLHQDRDEAEFAAPVVSVSLGDSAVFRLGGTVRGGKTTSLRLKSGDVIVFGGPARLIYHGIDRVLSGSSTLLAGGGRYNLTLRRVTPLTGNAAKEAP
ncbi:alpha-ketoglutarate-dependent dioxygenase AlkB [Acuticoccus sp. MNP-M23]|uniref:alpha-ketoglutarate-dependent dioxygenase AlkB family protein n=1 Tax=Acuticoccus sp. MNP-M23 TaxID=3072793 RepID=UPI002815255E|nr:alpha-ketoglutarate-dependent dioxygenase AlkB [Acuticoccus sp. MNP-M23]WMS44930.1 alpha-ketoglutarate-dependent dioxygenase AlkB [Acuticoccus sp. MNP-M23]